MATHGQTTDKIANIEVPHGGAIKGGITFINVLTFTSKLLLTNISTGSQNRNSEGDRKEGVMEVESLTIN